MVIGILPKLMFDQKFKFIIGLLMLIMKAIQDISSGKVDTLAIQGVIDKAYPLLPEELRKTATADEIYACIGSGRAFLSDVYSLFS